MLSVFDKPIMLSVSVLNVVIMNVIILNVVMLIVVMPSVVMLIAVAPYEESYYGGQNWSDQTFLTFYNEFSWIRDFLSLVWMKPGIEVIKHFFLSQSCSNFYKLEGKARNLYYKCFTIVIYDRNVQFTIVMTVASTIKLRS
jgi:hypothetical protein